MMKLIGIIITLAIIESEAFPSGAPSFACNDLRPLHAPSQASEPLPYEVAVSAVGAYVPGQTYDILIKGGDDPNFRGFLIQARTCADDTPVGTFINPSGDYKQVCTGNSAATHTNRIEKTSVTLQWTAPSVNTGSIRFWYSIVDVNSGGQSRFWAREMSDCIDEDVDECDPDPCKNGGTCTDGIGSFTCDCTDGYTGDLCDADIDDCDPNPCENGGTCTDGVDSFTCDCVDGYTGDLCDADIDDCDPNPCENGGTCTDGFDTFTCDCADGYSGDLCDVDIDDCDPNPCENGGTCTDTSRSFTCECADGYTGKTCQRARDTCVLRQIRGKARYNRRTMIATLNFSGVGDTATTECRLDRGAFENCTSPVTYSNLERGRHSITVRASCPNNDSVSRRFRFRVR